MIMIMMVIMQPAALKNFYVVFRMANNGNLRHSYDTIIALCGPILIMKRIHLQRRIINVDQDVDSDQCNWVKRFANG